MSDLMTCNTVLRHLVLFPCMLFLLWIIPPVSRADNWQVGPGGKPSRHSLSSEHGPSLPQLLWQGSLNAVVSQQAVIDGNIVALPRMFNINDVLHGTLIVTHDLQTGDTLWTADLPVDFPSTDWRNRVSAFRDGVVYATRSGNTNYSYMYALSAADGSIIWKSQGLVNESSTEGVSFTSEGDLVVGNFSSVMRISAPDGSTVWETNRSCPTSNGQEVAVFAGKGYYWEASPYGPKVSVIDLETGDGLYSSAALSPGFIQQLGLFIGPDGTVYAPRTMNNPTTDFLFALEDNGSELVIKWSVPLGYVPFSTFGTGPDGSVYSYSVNGEVIRLDPTTGSILNTSMAILSGTSPSPRMAVDAQGYLYITNGGFATGAFHSFNPDLSLRWTEPLLNVNVGGPAIGNGGTLIVCGTGNDVRAYKGTYVLQALFSADDTDPCAGDVVNFTDQSLGSVVSWSWHFPGGTPDYSTAQHPEVAYLSTGTYDVTLVVSDGSLTDTLIRPGYIEVLPLPAATFAGLPLFHLGDPPYLLTEGSPVGGTYSGPGVTEGYFYPDSAGQGTHEIKYTFTDPNGCSNFAVQTATVLPATYLNEIRTDRFILLPNPASQNTFLISDISFPCTISFRITDLNGNTVRELSNMGVPAGESRMSIDTESLLPGIYFWHLVSDLHTAVSGKILLIR
ncbi:MAG: PQQ-binding-like beta-propeller repeat protein [Bacteroidales bacterium]|nr:PQQ-binding-like beta-propeller repeat protein [Bacteroidales bacterium]